MKTRLILSTTIATLLSSAASHAASMTWDAGASTAWDTSALNWSGANWTNASDAVFGASGIGTVTIGTAVSANSLTFNNPGFTITGGTLTLSGSSVAANSSATIGSILAGTVGLAKSGTGTLTLTASNTYTGTTTISAGTLQLGDGTTGHDGSVAGSIVNNASLVYNLTGTTTYTGNVITGTGSLTMNGGTLILNVPNTYTGATIINAGTIGLNVTTGCIGSGTSALTLANSASALLVANYSNWGHSFSIGSLSGGGALGGNVNLQGSTMTVGTDNTSTAYAGVIYSSRWGAGNVIKTGTGTLTLSAVNTYSGTTTVSGGTLVVGPAGLMTSKAVVNSGATLKLNGWSINNGGISGNTSTAASTIVINGGTIDMASNYNDNGRAFTIGTGGATLSVEPGVSWSLNQDRTWQSGSGSNLAISNSSSLTLSGSGTGWFNLPISGTGALTKNGSGFWNLGVANSYTGATAINGGVLSVSNTNALGSGGNISFGGGSLQYYSGFVVDCSGRIVNSASPVAIDTNGQSLTFASSLASSNIGGLTKLGAGTLTLSGSNLYTGVTSINAGTLALGNANALAGGGNLSFGGGSLQFSASNQVDYSGKIVSSGSAIAIDTNSQNVTFASSLASSNTGGFTKLGAGTLTLTGSNAYTGATTISSGTLQIGNGTTDGSIATSSGIANSGALVYNLAGNQTYSGGISGAGTLAKNGAGALTLTAASSIYGVTTINSGTLQFGDGTSGHDGSVASTSVVNNGSLVFNLSGTQNLTYGAVISGSGSLTKSGSGALYFQSNPNTFTGPVTVNAGVLGLIRTNDTLGSGSSAVTLANVSGALLTLNFGNWGYANISLGSLSGGGASGGNVDLNGDTLIVGTNNTSTTFAGAIMSSRWGSGNLTKAGTGTLILTNTSTYYGTTTVSGGVLQLGDGTSGHDGSIATATVVNNAGLAFNYYGAMTYGGAISGTGAITKVSTGTLTLSGSNSVSGAVALNGGILALGNANALPVSGGAITFGGGTLQYSSSNQVDYSGRIAGTAGTLSIDTNSQSVTFASNLTSANTGGLTKLGAGALTLAGSNAYTGVTTISAGLLSFTNVNALPGWNTPGSYSVAAGAGLAVPNSVADSDVTSMLGTGNFAAGALFGFDTTAGNRTYAAGINGSYGLAKVGANTLTVTGANSYTVGTMLSGGVLQLGSASALGDPSGPLTISSGTLDLNGNNLTVGVLTGAGGVIATSVGGSVTLTASSAASSTYGGSIQNGAGLVGLTQAGSATLTLTGTSTYSGATAINSGTLQIGNGTVNGALGATAVSIAGGATLRFQANPSGATAPAWANITGAGTLELATAKTFDAGWGQPALPAGFTGTLQIDSGRVYTAANGGGLGGVTTVAVANGGQIGLWAGGTYTQNLTLAGTGYGESWYESALRLGSSGVTILTGNVTLSANATIGGVGGTNILSGVISGVGAAGLTVGTRAETGTVVLTGSNTYSGATAVNYGTLQFGNVNALYGGTTSGWTAANLSATSGATLAFNVGGTNEFTNGNVTTLLTNLLGANNGFKAGSALGFDTTDAVGGLFTIPDTISDSTGTGGGSVGVTKLGANTLALTGSNTYTGVTKINAGTLALGSAGALAGGGSLSFGGGTLQYSSSNQVDYSGRISGTTSAISIDTNSQNVTFASSLASSNTGGLTKLGLGTLTLTGSNAYTGVTSINAGTLALGNVNALAGGGNLSFGGGTLQFSASNQVDYSAKVVSSGSAIAIDTNGQNVTFASGMPGTGGLTKLGLGTLLLTGSSTYTGATTISGGTLQIGNGVSGSLAAGASVTVPSGGTLAVNLANSGTFGSAIFISGGVVNAIGTGTNTFSGNIGGYAYAVLNQNGTGTTILTGNNTFFGATNVNAGVLQLNYLYGAFDSTVNLNASNGLAFGATPVTVGGLSGSSGFSLMTTSGTGANLSVGNNNTDTTYAGVISGTNSASALTKIGAATLTLTGNSTYVGPTTISSGTLQLGNGTTDGSVAGGIVNNAALWYNVAGSPSYGGAISGTGTLTKSGPGTLTLTGASGFSGVTTVNSGTLQFGDGTSGHDGTLAGTLVNNASLVFNLAGTATYNCVIGGTGSLTTTGTGAVVFNATNTFTGPLTINAGAVQLGGGHSTLGSGSSAVTLANAASAAIYLNINNDGPINYSIGSLSGGGALGGNIIIDGGSTLTVGTDNTSTTYAGHIAQGSWANGNLTKVGTGTLTLSGTFDAWGSLAVNGGVLQVASTGSIFPWYSIATISTGGTLKLNGGWGTGSGGFNGNFGTRSSNLVIDGGTIDMASTYTNTGRSFTIGAGGATLKTEAGVTWALNNDISWQNYGGNIPAIPNNSSLTLDGSGAGQFNIPLSGTGTLTKIGTGSWSLSGSNTYSGAVAVNAGTLQLASSNALLGGGAISFNGGTLQYASNNVDYSGVIANSASAIAIDTNSQNVTFATSLASSNSGGLTKIGAGTLTLTGSHAYTGPTMVNAGTLQFGDGTTNGSIVAGSGIADNATLAFNVVGSQSYSDVISGTGVLTKSGAGTLTLTGSNAYTGATTISTGTLQIGDGTTDGSIASSSGITNNGALVYNLVGNQSYSHVIGGTGTLKKSGAGALTLTAANTYTGATTINSGTLQLGDGTSGHDGSLASASIANNGSLVYNLSGTVLYGGAISGTGGLTKSGSGTMQMTGWNTYSGPTVINAGVLEFGFTTGLNGTSAVTLANVAGAALANNFNNWGEEMVIGSLAGGGALGGNVILNGHSLTVGSDNTSTTFAGVIAPGSWGYGSLVKVGTGTLTLAGMNTYYGNTTVSGGVLDLTGQIRSSFGVITVGSGATLRLHNWTGLGTSGWFSGNDSPADSTLVLDGGTIDMAATAGAYNNGRGFTIGAGGATLLVSQPGTSWEVSSSPVFWQGAFGPVTDNSSLTLSGAGNGQLDIPLIGTGSLTKSGSGTWTLTGSNSYSGATTVNAGTLKLGNANALGTGDLTANGGTLNLNGNSVNVGALSGAAGAITSTVSGTSIVTTTFASGISTFAGGIADGPGVLALTKSGSGTLVLSGSSSYRGGTTVNGGTLNVNSDQALGAATGSVAIHDGATLQTSGMFDFDASRSFTVASGTGTIDTQGNTNTVNGPLSGAGVVAKEGSGTLILSGSVGIAGLNADNGATELTQSGSIGALNVAAGATVAVTAHSGGAYDVLNLSSLTLSGFSALNADSLVKGNDSALLGANGTATSGAAPASPEAVPEPGTWGLLATGLGLLVSGRRRKSK